MEPRALTAVERDALIDAGLDPVYCEPVDDGKSEEIRGRLFERKMVKWIAENIYKIDRAITSDFEINELCRQTIRLTMLGEEAATKNS